MSRKKPIALAGIAHLGDGFLFVSRRLPVDIGAQIDNLRDVVGRLKGVVVYSELMWLLETLLTTWKDLIDHPVMITPQ